MRWLLLWILLTAMMAGCVGEDPLRPDPVSQEDRHGPVPGVVDAELAVTGRWMDVFDGEVPAVSMALLPNGDVLIFSGVEAPEDDGSGAQFITSTPMAGESRVVHWTGDGGYEILTPSFSDGGAGDLFCSGLTILPDGRVLVVGGTDYTTFPSSLPGIPPVLGIQDARIFDPATNSWSQAQDMLFGRWYPSLLKTEDGSPLAVGGIEDLIQPLTLWDNLERYDLAEDQWYQPLMQSLLPMYARLHQIPSGPNAGQLFFSAAGTLWGPFGEHPEEVPAWDMYKLLDLEKGTATDVGLANFGARQYAVTTLLPLDPAKDYQAELLSYGGSVAHRASFIGTPLAERIDLSAETPVATIVNSMAQPRWNHNGVLLPTGEVVVIGGGLYDNVILLGAPNQPIMSTELFQPDSNTWIEFEGMQVPRMYHSSAALLPDGRVLAGGHVPLPGFTQAQRDTVNPQITETRLETYEPGYLFRGDRPYIEAAPTDIGYGDTFTIDVSLPAGRTIDQVLLMHPTATTHAWNAPERAVILEVVEVSGTEVTLQAPPSGLIMPPGPMMLMVMSDHELGPVPSPATWLTLA